MRRLFLVLLLSGCTPSLMGPEHPEYEDRCVIYAQPGERIVLDLEALARCDPPELYVVRFGWSA